MKIGRARPQAMPTMRCSTYDLQATPRVRLRRAISRTTGRRSRHTSGLRKLRADVITVPLRLWRTGSRFSAITPPVPKTLLSSRWSRRSVSRAIDARRARQRRGPHHAGEEPRGSRRRERARGGSSHQHEIGAGERWHGRLTRARAGAARSTGAPPRAGPRCGGAGPRVRRRRRAGRRSGGRRCSSGGGARWPAAR